MISYQGLSWSNGVFYKFAQDILGFGFLYNSSKQRHYYDDWIDKNCFSFVTTIFEYIITSQKNKRESKRERRSKKSEKP